MTEITNDQKSIRKYLIKTESETNNEYGMVPEKRDMGSLLNYGVINLDKPAGPSSHQVAAWVKDILEIEKIAHGGTLDPRVTGVLPVTLGHTIKTIRYLAQAQKEYVSIFRLHRDIQPDLIHNIIDQFKGKIYQTPPVRSAVKRQLRVREIYYMDILEIDNRDILLRVGCEAGTYIRALAHDIGEALGIGAHMQALRRTRAGVFLEKDSVTLHDVKDAYMFWREDEDEKPLRRIVQPMEYLFENIHTVVIRDSTIDAVCHGAQLAVPGVVKIDKALRKGDTIAYLSLKGEGVALGKALMDADDILKAREGQVAETLRALMEPGTYPKGWKTEKRG
jgi:H/ACA ribonucleoprotein complex subunit 4